MKRLLTQTLLSILFVIAVASAVVRAQVTPRKSDPTPPLRVVAPTAETPFDKSKVEGGKYLNDFFGLSFALPEDWVVLSNDDNKRILDKGQELVEEGASERKKRMVEASRQRGGFLVNAAKYSPGSVRPEFNALLMCMAERVPTAIIKSGADYVAQMRHVLEGSTAKMEVTGRPRTAKVGGVVFTVVDLKVTAGSIVAAQRHYVTVRKGYALVIAYNYYDDEDLKTFDELLASVKFK